MVEHESQLSPVAQDYLKVIWAAREWHDEPVTSKLLAQRLSVSAPTVSEQLRRLKDQGLIDHQPYGEVELTPLGLRHALAMVRRHRLLETFLVQTLGYGWDEVHNEAEVLEHACSERMIDAIDALLGSPDRDPHGDIIPGKDGSMPVSTAILLAQAHPGRWIIERVSDRDPALLRELDALQLSVGSLVDVLSPARPSAASLMLSVDSHDPFTPPEGAAFAIWLSPQG